MGNIDGDGNNDAVEVICVAGDTLIVIRGADITYSAFTVKTAVVYEPV